MATISTSKVERIFRKYCGEYGSPSCGESLFQCDWYGENALSILDDICIELGIYNDDEEN